MTESDEKAIRDIAKHKLEKCIGFNNSINEQKLLKAIVDAITEAIRVYDEQRH